MTGRGDTKGNINVRPICEFGGEFTGVKYSAVKIWRVNEGIREILR